jgi:hypothetical protein
MTSSEARITVVCPVVGHDDVLSQTERLPMLVFDLRPERDQVLAALLSEYFWLRSNGAAPPRSDATFIASMLGAWADSSDGTRALFLADDRAYGERLAEEVLAKIRAGRNEGAMEPTQRQEAAG